MTSRLLIAGIIILVLGVVMIGGGAFGIKGTTSTIRTFTETQPGEYVSSEIRLNSSAVVVVKPPATVGGMIPALDLNSLNSTDVGTYAVPSNSTVGGSATYARLLGDYYYVVFSSSQPSTTIVVAGSLGRTIVSGLLVALGFLLFLVGVILAVIGAIRNRRSARTAKERKSVSDADYYANRQGGAQQPPPPPPPPTSSP